MAANERVNHRGNKGWRTVARVAAAGPLLAVAGWIGVSRMLIPHDLPLPAALDAERRTFLGPGGRLSYYVAGEGRPLLLIHSVNAAASAYEVRPVFERYRHTRRVYALDLPGFGFSDRGPREYSPRLYTDAVVAMLAEIARDVGDQPVDALALSLGSEFLARAAVEQEQGFRSIALVTPTGFGAHEQRYGPPGSSRGRAGARRALEFPLWSRAFFDLLTSKPSLRYFLKQAFGSYQAIDAGVLHYAYPTSHQPEAQHAPYAFISGLLFSADIDRVYESLRLPVWLAYGPYDRFTDFGDLSNVRGRANWTIERFETGGMPHFTVSRAFLAAYDAFLDGAAPGVAASAASVGPWSDRTPPGNP